MYIYLHIYLYICVSVSMYTCYNRRFPVFFISSAVNHIPHLSLPRLCSFRSFSIPLSYPLADTLKMNINNAAQKMYYSVLNE